MRFAALPIGLSVLVLSLVSSATAVPTPLRIGVGTVQSASLGLPWQGRLINGRTLRESRLVRYTDQYRADGRFFGTNELVGLIERSAARVWRRHSGVRLSVGELSAPAGGDVPGHHSHENGRDVDIAFYMTDTQGNPVYSRIFENVGADGRAIREPSSARFDDARNWELVAGLITDPDAPVQYIFVANSIRHRLLQVGRRLGAPSVVMDRAARVMNQPSSGHPHRNHFHVRIFCAPGESTRVS